MKISIKSICLLLVLVSSFNLTFSISYAENSNSIDINFGELLTQQEKNGYAPFSGENMLENFYQAKAELPDEIPVLDSFKISGQNEFFVSVSGNDTSVGSEEEPLATVCEALKRISELSNSEREQGSVIYLREGEYHIDDTINITSEHTSDSAALFLSAYQDENVVISADESVALTKAVCVTRDNMDVFSYGRINDDAVGNLFYITYDDLGVEDISYESVFSMNDMLMQISRYPNQGTDTVNNVIKDGSYINSEGLIRTGLPMEWKSKEERPFTWKDTGNIHIFGRVANEWSLTDGLVWFDENTKTVKSTSSITPNYSPVTTNFWGSIPSTYYYTNIFEEIDTFGEWFADEDLRRFYFYLPESVDKESTFINYLTYNGYALDISDSRNVVINGIDISHVDKGINIRNSTGVVVQNSVISDTCSTAVNMYNTEKCGILNSDIHSVKKSYAVNILQSEERVSELVPRRNFIQNTSINNVSQAINISGSSGNIVSHNLIENTSYSAVNLSGAENILEYNEFSGVANKITDAGGIYVGGDIKNRANTIRYNYFHDSKPDKKNARAIYNDDCSDMSWNYGNVVKNFAYGLFLHSGDDHVIKDNIVINATTYIRNSEDYATQKSLMKNYFFKSSPQFINGYTTYDLENSETWQTRYNGILKEKYEQILQAKTGVDNDVEEIYDKIINVIKRKNNATEYENAEAVQNACDLVADTGCYYIGNTYVVPGNKYSNGYGPSNYGLYNTCEPENGGKPKVIYTDAELSGNDYDISEYIKNIGLINANVRVCEKPFIYMEQKKEFAKDEFTGISWSGNSNCSYYQAEIATDPEFNNIVISYDTSSAEYPVYTYSYDKDADCNVKNKTSNFDFQTNVPYFARVTSVSLASCVENPSVSSDTVEFILREGLKYSKEKADVESYFGNTSMKIKVGGMIPGYLLNSNDRQITLMLVENDEIKHIRQIDASQNGSFSYVFYEDITNNTRIRIRAGNEDVTEEVFKNKAQIVTEVMFSSDNKNINVGEVVTATVKINNMLDVTDVFTMTVAAYDEKNNLIGCSIVDSEKLDTGRIYELSNQYTIPDGAKTVKAFLWNKNNMKPLANALK